MATQVIQVDPGDSRAARLAAAKAARALKKGRLVAFATETVYGIAALASDPEAMERLRELKSRPKRPFSVHFADPQDVRRYVREVPPAAARLIDKSWPGPVTLILPTGGGLGDPKLQRAGLYEVLTYEGCIGLRCPNALVARLMLSGAGGVVVAPSANLSGRRSPRTASQVLRVLDGRIDLLLDTGPTRLGMDSTVVRFDGDEWRVVRKGVHDTRAIRRMLAKTYLFVCTGNTCRSPMAVGLVRRLVARKRGCSVSDLEKLGIRVMSAGAFAVDGARASPEAVRAARKRGVDISRHRSQKLTSQLIRDADVVLCLSGFHVSEVRRLAPSAAHKIRVLDERGDIADPIGGGPDVYGHTAERIEKALKAYLAKDKA